MSDAKKKPERLSERLSIPDERGSILYACPPSLPDEYENVGKEILNHNFYKLSLPLGRNIAPLIRAAYDDAAERTLENQLCLREVRDIIIGNRVLWVYNTNVITPDGIYVVDDLKATGVTNILKLSELEKKLRGGKEREGVRFSSEDSLENHNIRFAPKETYFFGRHKPEEVARSGIMIATFGVQGAKIMAGTSACFENGLDIIGEEAKKGRILQRVTAVFEDYLSRRLIVKVSSAGKHMAGQALGVFI